MVRMFRKDTEMSCKYNDEMIGNRLCGSRGIDDTVPPCPECGEYPTRVDYFFHIRKQNRINRKTKKPISLERRTYYYCPCSANITEWIGPLYNEDNEIVLPSYEMARIAWSAGTNRANWEEQKGE